MKRIRDWCLVALLCLPNIAFAQTDAVGIRVFDIHPHTSSYLEPAEVFSGCPVVGNTIDTDCLAEEAYDFAQRTGALSLVPGSNQFRDSYKDLFLRWNDLGPTMSTERFMSKASGTGIYLPQSGQRNTFAVARYESDFNAKILLLTQKFAMLSNQTPALRAELFEYIDSLQASMGELNATNARFLGTLTTLKAMVENLPSLSQAELNAQKAELGERLSGLADRVTRVEETKADKADVANIEAKLSMKASQSDVTIVESQLSLKANQSDFADLAAVVSLLKNPPSVAVPLIGVQNPDYASEVKEDRKSVV